MIQITRRFNFSAARQYQLNSGKWYGHDYQLLVTLKGLIDPENGYLVDLKILKTLLKEKLISKINHRHLNGEVGFLVGKNLTMEVLTMAIFEQINAIDFPGNAVLEKVQLTIPGLDFMYSPTILSSKNDINSN